MGCGLLASTVGPWLLQSVEMSVYPVLTDWRPTSAVRDGKDLIVAGTMVKSRGECRFIPPQRARDEFSGKPLAIVSSAPSDGTLNWDGNDGRPQEFGPWRVLNGANRVVSFYSEHQCPGSPWRTFSQLGTLPVLRNGYSPP